MRKFLAGGLLALGLLSCMSYGDNVAQSISEESFRETEILFADLVRLYLGMDPESSVEDLEGELARLDDLETFNQDYRARILGLNALWFELQGKRNRSLSYREQLRDTNRLDELLPITEALSSEAPLTVLEKGLPTLYEPRFIYLFLGEESFRSGDFGKALSLYEQIPVSLPPDLAAFAEKRIDDSLRLYQSGMDMAEGAELLTRERLTLMDYIRLFHLQTELLPGWDRKNDEMTLAAWKERRVIGIAEGGDTILIRRKLADILFRTSYLLEQDRGLIPGEIPVELPPAYAHLEQSPIADVPLGDVDFPAILQAVEREWINMPDGEHFYPDEPVPGRDLISLFDRLNNYY